MFDITEQSLIRHLSVHRVRTLLLKTTASASDFVVCYSQHLPDLRFELSKRWYFGGSTVLGMQSQAVDTQSLCSHGSVLIKGVWGPEFQILQSPFWLLFV